MNDTMWHNFLRFMLGYIILLYLSIRYLYGISCSSTIKTVSVLIVHVPDEVSVLIVHVPDEVKLSRVRSWIG
jgi:hypothetical protein